MTNGITSRLLPEGKRAFPTAPASKEKEPCCIKRYFVFLALCLLLLFGCTGFAQEDSEYSRVVDVPGRGPMQYYAQNDPQWARSLYEPVYSKNYRIFKDSGCGPTSVAMAIACQVPSERLPELIAFARKPEEGFPFCSCSVNGYRCDRTHELTYPTAGEDFLSHLPVIFASYATGNNTRRAKYRTEDTATSILLFPSLAESYGLQYLAVREWEDARAAIEAGASVITTVSRGIFTPVSHYLFLASVDEEWIYILDPYMRENYDELDTKHILEVVEPGLVRAKLSDFDRLGFSGYYVLSAQTLDLP